VLTPKEREVLVTFMSFNGDLADKDRFSSTFRKEGKPYIIHIGYVEGYDVKQKTLSVVINNKKFIESDQTIKSLNVRVIETDNGVKITSIQCYLKAERPRYAE
jgi:hypothetical protein